MRVSRLWLSPAASARDAAAGPLFFDLALVSLHGRVKR
jgi:hypothetical protein